MTRLTIFPKTDIRKGESMSELSKAQKQVARFYKILNNLYRRRRRYQQGSKEYQVLTARIMNLEAIRNIVAKPQSEEGKRCLGN